MKKNSVFDFKDYKTYLNFALELRSETTKGQRSKLSEAINCNPSYLSQVLNADIHLSPEQGHKANSFLGHTAAESKYFLNLLLLARSGTADLRAYYSEELQQQRQERLSIKNRIQTNRELTESDQARYYSSWYYAAIHVCISLPNLRTREKIASALNLSLQKVNEVLEFLVETGIIITHGTEFRPGDTILHLGTDSNFITKHHTNWRMKAIESLDFIDPKELHYSGVITCGQDDIAKIKEILVQAILEVRETVKAAKDETSFVYTLDFFRLLDQKMTR